MVVLSLGSGIPPIRLSRPPVSIARHYKGAARWFERAKGKNSLEPHQPSGSSCSVDLRLLEKVGQSESGPGLALRTLPLPTECMARCGSRQRWRRGSRITFGPLKKSFPNEASSIDQEPKRPSNRRRTWYAVMGIVAWIVFRFLPPPWYVIVAIAFLAPGGLIYTAWRDSSPR